MKFYVSFCNIFSSNPNEEITVATSHQTTISTPFQALVKAPEPAAFTVLMSICFITLLTMSITEQHHVVCVVQDIIKHRVVVTNQIYSCCNTVTLSCTLLSDLINISEEVLL